MRPRLVPAERELRHQEAVQVQRAADAGPERDDELEALAADGGQALEGDVVRHADGLAKQRLERSPEVESDPAPVVEIRGGQDAPVGDGARKAHGDPVEARERSGEPHERPEQRARRLADRRADPDLGREQRPALVEHRGLDSRPADVHGERPRFVVSFSAGARRRAPAREPRPPGDGVEGETLRVGSTPANFRRLRRFPRSRVPDTPIVGCPCEGCASAR